MGTVEYIEIEVGVILTDGAIEEGDIVISADSIHSVVRPQTWDYAHSFKPADYGMDVAESNMSLRQGVTKLFFQHQGQQLWAFMYKDKYNQPP